MLLNCNLPSICHRCQAGGAHNVLDSILIWRARLLFDSFYVVLEHLDGAKPLFTFQFFWLTSHSEIRSITWLFHY